MVPVLVSNHIILEKAGVTRLLDTAETIVVTIFVIQENRLGGPTTEIS